MNEQMHKCKTCENQIPDWLHYCLSCQNKLNNNGLCGFCGINPNDIKNKKVFLRKYCQECQNIVIPEIEKRTQRKIFSSKYRPPGSKEDTYQTKHGLL